MNTLQQKASQLFNNPMAPESLNKYNQEAWLKALAFLGERYVHHPTNHIVRVQ